MKYIVKNGTNDNVLVLLHGTGGDAYNLLELADYLDPAATKIGTEGDIVEDGMRRYFERNPDGSFVEESLMRETTVLYETIAEALEESDLTEKNVILVGYSNGSNIALNILKEYETNYRVALLFHPSSVRPGVPFKKQHKLNCSGINILTHRITVANQLDLSAGGGHRTTSIVALSCGILLTKRNIVQRKDLAGDTGRQRICGQLAGQQP